MTIPQELTWWLDEYGINDRIARAAVLAQNGVPVEVVPAMEELE